MRTAWGEVDICEKVFAWTDRSHLFLEEKVYIFAFPDQSISNKWSKVAYFLQVSDNATIPNFVSFQENPVLVTLKVFFEQSYASLPGKK